MASTIEKKKHQDYEPQEYKRKLEKMDPGWALKMEYKYMLMFANYLSRENFVGTFQFGKIYRAKYPVTPILDEYAMVKIWEAPKINKHDQADNFARAMNESILLQHEKMIEHPGMIEFHSFYRDGEHLAAMYNFNPLDSVHNLAPKDSFTWLQRMKVALGFARLLKFFHDGTSKFLVRNIAAAHILVDKEYNPKLCDFSMMVGGIFPNETMYECNGCYGYVDPNISSSGKWSDKTDVFAFGVVLLNLITKRVDTEEDRQFKDPLLHVWVWDLCESENGSRKSPLLLVDKGLTRHPSFSFSDGCAITNIAMECIKRVAEERPTMKQVVKYLLKLEVIKENAEFLGLAPKDDKLTNTDVLVSETINALRL